MIKEIEEVIEKYGCKKIVFYDDLFIANVPRLKKIVELIRKKNIHKKVSFHVSCRANLINKDLAKLLVKMNAITANMGLESGSEKVLKYLKGESVSKEINMRAVEILHDHGLDVGASFIIGSPIDTKETIMETYDFIKKSKLSTFDVFFMTPFPGTLIWDYALEKGLVSEDMNFKYLDVSTRNILDKKSVIVCENLSKEELQNLYNKFMRLKKVRFVKNVIKQSIKRPGLVMHFAYNKVKFLLGRN